jgi:hypothetical protein
MQQLWQALMQLQPVSQQFDPNMSPSLQNDARQMQPRFFPQNAQDPMERSPGPNIDRNAIQPEFIQQLIDRLRQENT